MGTRRAKSATPARLLAAAALATAVAAFACTSFDGLEPGSGGAPQGGGGAGGAEPPAPTGFLPLLDAAELCSLVFRCPALGGSVLLSTGIPIVQVDAAGAPVISNFSACLDWLTAPIEPGRLGFDETRDVLICLAASSTCAAAAANCLPFELAEDPAAACAAEPPTRCEGSTSVACPAGITAHCAHDSFGPGSQCLTGTLGATACAVGACSVPELTCDEPYAFACEATGLRTGLSCAAYGLSCAPGGGCVASGGPSPCATLGQQRCDAGDRRVRTCAVVTETGFAEAEVSCDALARTCVLEGGAAARCASASELCSPYDPDQNVCDMDTLRVCVQGEPAVIDCAALGKTCQPALMDGSKTARCE